MVVTIRLETAVGGLVKRGKIPPFNRSPDVLFWGTRVFRHVREPIEGDPEVVYREAFSFALVDPPDPAPIEPTGRLG